MSYGIGQAGLREKAIDSCLHQQLSAPPILGFIFTFAEVRLWSAEPTITRNKQEPQAPPPAAFLFVCQA
jgi:hypothetical protein